MVLFSWRVSFDRAAAHEMPAPDRSIARESARARPPRVSWLSPAHDAARPIDRHEAPVHQLLLLRKRYPSLRQRCRRYRPATRDKDVSIREKVVLSLWRSSSSSRMNGEMPSVYLRHEFSSCNRSFSFSQFRSSLMRASYAYRHSPLYYINISFAKEKFDPALSLSSGHRLFAPLPLSLSGSRSFFRREDRAILAAAGRRSRLRKLAKRALRRSLPLMMQLS